MKHGISLLVLIAGLAGYLHAQTDYSQWECGYMRAKSQQTALFEKGLMAHNKKFHNAAPYKIGVFEVITGPNSGSYFVAMGPMTWTQIAGRPSGDEHEMDWDKNVEPYIDWEGENSYWRQDKDILYRATGSDQFRHSRLRNFTLLPGQQDRFVMLLKQFAEVYKQKAYPASYFVYWRQGMSQGPHVITEINMDGWAYFDRPNTFEKDFDEVHGAGAYNRFIDEFELCVDRAKTFDELIIFNPELSSDY